MLQEGTNQTGSAEIYESLRLILEREQSRQIALEEALDVGDSLIVFFEVLAEGIGQSDE